MNLTDQAIAEFKRLYRQEYGVDLTEEEAREYSMRLIKLVKVVYSDQTPFAKTRLNQTLTSTTNS